MASPLHNLRILLPAAVVVALAACGNGDSTGAGSDDEGSDFESVNIGVVSDTATTPLFVASEQGLFAKQGLDANLKIYSSGSDMNKALAAGDVEFATASTTSLPSSRAAGLLTQLVSGGQNDATTKTWDNALGIVGSAKAGVESDDMSSLKGKKVGYLAGSTGEAYLRAALAKHGMKMSDIKPVSLDVSDHPVSLRQGDIDASMAWEPFLSQSIRELGDDAAVPSRGEGVLGYVIGAAGTDEVLKKNPDVAKKFVAAMAEGAQFTRESPEDAAEIYTHFVKGVKVEDASSAINELAFDPRISGCTIDALGATASRMAKEGQIKKAPSTDSLYTTDIITKVEEENPEWFDDLPKIPDACE